ncbi:MAG: hypothetical protein GXO69_11045 [Acidobacteria bacterium]|nr:hypothetical protein [Acidobacteriota bacterium]
MTGDEPFFWTLLLMIILGGYGLAILQIFVVVAVEPEQILTHHRGNRDERQIYLREQFGINI